MLDAAWPIEEGRVMVSKSFPSCVQCSGFHIPVAVASAIESECACFEASESTLASAEAMVLWSAVIAARSLDFTAKLCEACDAAAPESVWPATCEEMMAALFDAAAAAAALAAAAMEAACAVASGEGEVAGEAAARALRPERTKSATRILV